MFIPNPEFPDATDDQMWEQVRLWRDVQLAQSDWTQLPDVSTTKRLGLNTVKRYVT